MSAEKFNTNELKYELRTSPMALVEPDLKDFPVLGLSSSNVQIPANTQTTWPSHNGIYSRSDHNVNSRFHHTESNRARNFAQNRNVHRNDFNTHNTRTEPIRLNDRKQHDGYRRERHQQNSCDQTNSRNDYPNSRSSEMDSRLDSQTRYQISRRNYNNSTYFNKNNAVYQNRGRFDRGSDEFQSRNNVPENKTIHTNPKKRTVINYSLAKNSIVELNTCENAWIPSRRVPQKPIESNEINIEEILKKVRSILNKITPETMVELTKSILDMPITTYESLSKIIDLLFQKAIDEPKFTPQYAYICSEMKHIEVISDDHKTKTSFKQLIVRKCKQTFDLVSATEKNAIESLLEIESCKDQTLKKELQCKYEENERNQRKRSVGNCRFMCEMFKVKLLNSNVLEMCVTHLLKFPKEEPLECLCNILKHIGKYLNPGNTFEKLREFSSASYKTKISSRIRFMILDTIELKNNNWTPRNALIKPKTLNEIDKEFNMSSTKNLKISPQIEKSSSCYQYSNTKKVCTKTSDVQIKSQSGSHEHTFAVPVIASSSSNTAAPPPSQTKKSKRHVSSSSSPPPQEENKIKSPNRYAALAKITDGAIENEGEINEEKKSSSSSELKKTEPDSLTKSSEIELNACKNPWVPRFRNSQKWTETNSVEIEKTEKKTQESPKPNKSIEFMKNNAQKTVKRQQKTKKKFQESPKPNKSIELMKNSEQKTAVKMQQTVINAEKTVKFKSKPAEKKKIQPDSLTKSSENELNTCENLKIPNRCNSVKSTVTTEVKIEKIEKKVLKLPEPDLPIKIMTETHQDSCETFSSIIFSMTQENMVASTNKLTPRISSNDQIEEIIDVLFERATTEPNCIPLVVETCNILKKVVVSADNGSKHVSFKKLLAVHCQKLLRMEKLDRDLENRTPVISKETYTMIGELFNKKLLPLNVLVEFITEIPNRFTGDSIENICYLLTIIGAEIERPYTLKPTIKFLETFINNDVKPISPKLKGVVTDLIKLRNNKWRPSEKIDPHPSIIETDQTCSQSEVENPWPTPEGVKEDDETRTRRTKYFSEMIAESYSNIKLKCVAFSKRIVEFDFRGCFRNFMNYCQSFIW